MAVKEKALRRLADKLNAAGVRWAMGGSWLLHHHGLLEIYHDFDVVAAAEDAEQADRVLSRLGMRHQGEYTVSYHFDGADVDLCASMVLGGCHAVFDEASVAGTAEVLGAAVPLMHLEDWYVYYALMGKTERAALLAEHFRACGMAHPERLRACIREPLPESILAPLREIIGGEA